MIRPVSAAELTAEQAALWLAFLEAYTSSRARPAVDIFLRALVGAPR